MVSEATWLVKGNGKLNVLRRPCGWCAEWSRSFAFAAQHFPGHEECAECSGNAFGPDDAAAPADPRPFRWECSDRRWCWPRRPWAPQSAVPGNGEVQVMRQRPGPFDGTGDDAARQ